MLIKESEEFYKLIENEIKRILNIDFSIYFLCCKNEYWRVDYNDKIISILEGPIIIENKIFWVFSHYTNEYGIENFPINIISKEEIESLIYADKNIKRVK